MTEQNNNPLHGVTLEQILNALVEHYEWSGLAERIDIRCFKSDPSIKSSLTFLRKTPWAREKVEGLYVKLMRTKRPLCTCQADRRRDLPRGAVVWPWRRCWAGSV